MTPAMMSWPGWPGDHPDHLDDAPVIRGPATSVTIASLGALVRLAPAWLISAATIAGLAALLVANRDGFAAGPSRDEVANAAFTRDVVVDEIIRFGRTDLTGEVVATDAVVWRPGSIGRGPSGLTAFSQDLHDSIVDARLLIESVTPNGEEVRLRWSLIGTIRRPFLGLAPGSVPVLVSGEFVVRLRDGIVQGFIVSVDGQVRSLADLDA